MRADCRSRTHVRARKARRNHFARQQGNNRRSLCNDRMDCPDIQAGVQGQIFLEIHQPPILKQSRQKSGVGSSIGDDPADHQEALEDRDYIHPIESCSGILNSPARYLWQPRHCQRQPVIGQLIDRALRCHREREPHAVVEAKYNVGAELAEQIRWWSIHSNRDATKPQTKDVLGERYRNRRLAFGCPVRTWPFILGSNSSEKAGCCTGRKVSPSKSTGS